MEPKPIGARGGAAMFPTAQIQAALFWRTFVLVMQSRRISIRNGAWQSDML